MIFNGNGKKPESMLKRLRIKFLAIILGIITLVLGVIFIFANFSIKYLNELQYKYFANFLIEQEDLKIATVAKQYRDHIKEYYLSIDELNVLAIQENLPFDIFSMRNFFIVKYNYTGKIIEIISSHPINYSNEEITELTQQVFHTKKYDGKIEGLDYHLGKKDYGYIAVYFDRKSDDNMYYLIESVLFTVFGFSFLLAFLLSFFLSSWALYPIKTAFNKQRQFIADTSHELKTPLAVMNTNIDVLEYEIGENKWLGYIKAESHRMNELVKDLLYLAKYDASEMIYDFKTFNISRAIENASLPFESLAFETGFTLELDIEPNLHYYGDENRIKQLAIIFIDNAIKNCNEGGTIKVSLSFHNSKKILSVYNTGQGLNEEQKKKIFNRFYRADVSRARDTGGSGLGLSIAATIAQAHKTRINVHTEEGQWIEFSILL